MTAPAGAGPLAARAATSPVSRDILVDVTRRIRVRHDLSDAEEAALFACIDGVTDWPAGEVFIHAGERLEHSTVLLDGLLGRTKSTGAGRQIMEVHVPGDWADLHSFLLKRLDSDITALTPVRVATISHAGLAEVVATRPHLTRVLWFLTCLDAAISREWEVTLGRRDARAGLAHLLCEMQARLELVGRADLDGFDLALTQTQLGECLGLTPVHVSRVARQLREQGLAVLSRGRVDVLDRTGLATAGEWTPDYLYLDGPDFSAR